MPVITGEVQINLGEMMLEEPHAIEAARPEQVAPQTAPPSDAGPPGLAEVVESIEPVALREAMRHVFGQMTRVLDYLRLVESGLAQDKTLRNTIIIFKLVHEKAVALLGYLDAAAKAAGAGDEVLRGVLDATGFAVTHELRRVFVDETPKLNTPEQSKCSRAELTRAYGVLHNCFQQSTITLAQVFDPSLEGTRLFDDYKVKLEQSIVLHRELELLVEQVYRAEAEAGLLTKISLINRLKTFREETMQFLMYRDWEEFEAFVEEITKNYEAMNDFGPLLHTFSRYLETLVSQVGMRDVLVNYRSSQAE